MVKFTEKYNTELDEFYNSSKNSVLTVCFHYLRGVMEVLAVLFILYKTEYFPDYFTDKDIRYVALNIFASYAIISMSFNAFFSALMAIGGHNEMSNFVPLMTSGVAKIQIFHPHTFLRNFITRPVVAGVFYMCTIFISLASLDPVRVKLVVTHEFALNAFLLSVCVNAATGLVKVLLWHFLINGDPIFRVEPIIDVFNKNEIRTMPTESGETPQEENLQTIPENGEYEPPKVNSYFSCTV